MNAKMELEQVAYAQMSITQSMAKGYTAIQAAQIHLDSLRFISAIKTMDTAERIVFMAMCLNGLQG